MKKMYLFIRISVIFLLLGSHGCKNDDNNRDENKFTGCIREREEYIHVSSEEGSIYYFKNQAVYAIKYSPYLGGQNIDSEIYVIICDLPENLRELGKAVEFSGLFKELFRDEIDLFEPIPSGTEIYFSDSLEINIL